MSGINESLRTLLSNNDKMISINKRKTFHEHDYGVIKSMLQKSVRQNDFDQCLDALFEGLLMYIVRAIQLKDGNMSTDGKIKFNSVMRNISNTLNRLRVIAIEDIGIGDPELVLFLKPLLEKLSDKSFILDKSNFDTCVEYMYQIAMRMTDSTKKKCRLPSHLRAAFWRLYQPYCDGYDDLEEYKTLEIDNGTNTSTAFKKLWNAKNDGCFYYWFKYVFELETNATNTNWRKKTSSIKNAKELLEFVIEKEKGGLKKETFDLMLKWFGSVKTNLNKKGIHGEFWIFGVHVILLSYKVDGDLNKSMVDMYTVASDMVKQRFLDFINKESLVLKNEYIDIHTKQGLANGATHLDFVKVGSRIDENSEMIDENMKVYKLVYEKLSDLKIDFSAPKFLPDPAKEKSTTSSKKRKNASSSSTKNATSGYLRSTKKIKSM